MQLLVLSLSPVVSHTFPCCTGFDTSHFCFHSATLKVVLIVFTFGMTKEDVHLTARGFFLKTHPQSNQEENIRLTPVKGHPTKYLTSPPQNCQGHSKQGKSEELSQARGT